MPPRKDERLTIAPLGEFYEDLLTVDSWINKRSKAVQGNCLLCSKLEKKQKKIQETIAYLADKRGISPDELWKSILRGEAREIEPDEIYITEE